MLRLPQHLQNVKVDSRELARVAGMLNAMGQRIADDKEFRADSVETAFFARQLEYVRAREQERLYAENKALKFFNVATDVPAGAESFVTRQWDIAGTAKIITNFADDLPKVTAIGREKVQRVQSIGASYDYSIQEIAASQFSGVPLDRKKAEAVRRIMENTVDQLVAFGDSSAELLGILNHPNVGDVTPLHGDWDNPSTTGAQILEDMNALCWSVKLQTKGLFEATWMLYAQDLYQIIATKPYSAMIAKTVLQVFKEANPGVTVDSWHKLDLADEAGTGPRAMAYHRAPTVVEIVLPSPFQQLPPQPKNLAFDIPCHQRVGGIDLHYPLACAYQDGLLA